MNNRIFLLLFFVVGSVLHAIAQDDLYFVPTKKKVTPKTDVYTSSDYDNWADNRNSTIDVDAYNRRGTSDKTNESEYYSEDNDTESFTSRIVRFHAPGVTVVSSPYYTEYIDVYADPWYSYYSPYSWHNYTWSSHYGWSYSWGWNHPYHWYYSCYDPWWGWHGHYHPVYHHAWHPHHGGHHHHHYYPSRTEQHRRPTASNRGYRPSTERGTRPSTGRPSKADRPSRHNREHVSTNRGDAPKNHKTVSTDRNSRRPSSTVSPSRTERPQRVMSGGSRTQRSMGGSRSSGGRRR